MKKLALIFIFSCFCFACVAQRIILSNSATLDLPEGMVKAQKSEIASLATQRFGGSTYLSKRIQNNPEKVYLVNDIVVYMTSAAVKQKKGILKISKMASDDIGMQIKGYSSKIENIGGKDVFVVDQISEGAKMYRFTTVNSAENFVVTGFVQYPPGDKEKARTVLEGLIKGLKFDGE